MAASWAAVSISEDMEEINDWVWVVGSCWDVTPATRPQWQGGIEKV
jgi:hypothetical protein